MPITGFYQLAEDDTNLDLIASKLGLSSPYHELFQPNMATLEAAARGAGYLGGSDQGTILIPGTVLEVPLSALEYYQAHHVVSSEVPSEVPSTFQASVEMEE